MFKFNVINMNTPNQSIAAENKEWNEVGSILRKIFSTECEDNEENKYEYFSKTLKMIKNFPELITKYHGIKKQEFITFRWNQKIIKNIKRVEFMIANKASSLLKINQKIKRIIRLIKSRDSIVVATMSETIQFFKQKIEQNYIRKFGDLIHYSTELSEEELTYAIENLIYPHIVSTVGEILAPSILKIIMKQPFNELLMSISSLTILQKVIDETIDEFRFS